MWKPARLEDSRGGLARRFFKNRQDPAPTRDLSARKPVGFGGPRDQPMWPIKSKPWVNAEALGSGNLSKGSLISHPPFQDKIYEVATTTTLQAHSGCPQCATRICPLALGQIVTGQISQHAPHSTPRPDLYDFAEVQSGCAISSLLLCLQQFEMQ